MFTNSKPITMTYLSHKDGVKARKRKCCILCGQWIEVGEIKDVRTGVDGSQFWTMDMHPECHHYEQHSPDFDKSWYEDSCGDPAFNRSDAIEFKSQSSTVQLHT